MLQMYAVFELMSLLLVVFLFGCNWFGFFFQADERITVNEHISFVDHQTNMVRLAKQIARTAQDMVCGLSSVCT